MPLLDDAMHFRPAGFDHVTFGCRNVIGMRGNEALGWLKRPVVTHVVGIYWKRKACRGAGRYSMTFPGVVMAKQTATRVQFTQLW